VPAVSNGQVVDVVTGRLTRGVGSRKKERSYGVWESVHSPDRSDLGARAFGRRGRDRTRGNAAQQQVKVAEL
jgi:hypothetical protein